MSAPPTLTVLSLGPPSWRSWRERAAPDWIGGARSAACPTAPSSSTPAGSRPASTSILSGSKAAELSRSTSWTTGEASARNWERTRRETVRERVGGTLRGVSNRGRRSRRTRETEMCRKKARGERRSVLVQDHVGGNQPLSLRVHRQRQTLQGVGPQQRRGIVFSKHYDGDYAPALYRAHACP